MKVVLYFNCFCFLSLETAQWLPDERHLSPTSSERRPFIYRVPLPSRLIFFFGTHTHMHSHQTHNYINTSFLFLLCILFSIIINPIVFEMACRLSVRPGYVPCTTGLKKCISVFLLYTLHIYMWFLLPTFLCRRQNY